MISWRGSSDLELKTPKYYSLFSYEDIIEGVQFLRKLFPENDFYYIGSSMAGTVGGNVLAKIPDEFKGAVLN